MLTIYDILLATLSMMIGVVLGWFIGYIEGSR